MWCSYVSIAVMGILDNCMSWTLLFVMNVYYNLNQKVFKVDDSGMKSIPSTSVILVCCNR